MAKVFVALCFVDVDMKLSIVIVTLLGCEARITLVLNADNTGLPVTGEQHGAVRYVPSIAAFASLAV